MSQKYEIFGKYVLLDKVAAGGMAEVYRAKSPGAEGIGKILAIKRILPQYSSNSEFIEMFKTEAKIAINLTQANIGQIYEFGVEKDQFFLLMEFIDGRNLRQLLSRCTKVQKTLTIEQCVFIISQVANGLDYAHRCIDKNTGGPLNIIHRDMSPQNIMVSFEGEVKIVDFGIAKAESKIEVTRAGTLKGKFGYMSPEQAEGLELDARTDIFSVGIVLWELLSGERLFIANNEVNTIRKIKECQIPSLKKINPHIHEELERITAKALAKDRNLRYQTAAELHRDLSRFLYRVNPEFTAHDLSVAIKTLFKDEILADRKKGIEYSKVEMPSIHTSVNEEQRTGTVTETNGHLFTIAKTITEKSTAQDNQLSELKLDPGPQTPHTEPKGPALPRKIAYFDPKSRGMPPSAGFPQSGPDLNSFSFYRPTYARFLPSIIFMVVVGTLGFSFLRNYETLFESATQFIKRVSNQGEKAYENAESQLLGSKDPNKDSVAREKAEIKLIKVTMMVRSNPQGAEITVDGENMGVTPAEVKLDMNKPVTISIKRDGYIPYVKDLVPTTSPQEFNATLQKAAIGYLNIDVQPTSAVIYLDNQKLAERLPITHYPVPAGRTIVVKAVNLSGLSDQQKVLIKQDTVQSVILYLQKNKK